MRPRVATALVACALGALLLGGCSGASGDGARASSTASATGAWRALSPANLSRTEVGAARIGRFIYVVGGFLPSQETTNAVERYDIRGDRWTQLEPLLIAVNHPAVTAHRGRLYVYGGYTDSTFGRVTGALQRLDPRSGGWSLLPESRTPRAAAGIGASEGFLYAAGGAAGGRPLRTLEIFNLAQRRWRPGPPMRVAREHVAAAMTRDGFYVLGGRDGARNLGTVERFGLEGGRWARLPSLRTARSGFAATTARGRVVALGGEELTPGGATIRPVELYQPLARHWLRLPGMRTPRHGLGAAAQGRRVYSLEGGPQPGFAFSNAIEFLDLPRRLLR